MAFPKQEFLSQFFTSNGVREDMSKGDRLSTFISFWKNEQLGSQQRYLSTWWSPAVLLNDTSSLPEEFAVAPLLAF